MVTYNKNSTQSAYSGKSSNGYSVKINEPNTPCPKHVPGCCGKCFIRQCANCPHYGR